MRILCLHGVGSSGRICQNQFRPFLLAADPSYDFVFIDGPAQCGRGPGMGSHLDGPFYSHTNGYGPEDMADAIHHLEKVVDEFGPFHGVLGFSQGAALALAYIHQRQEMNKPVTFRFALCFSSVIPCSADKDFGRRLIPRICPLRWSTITSDTTPEWCTTHSNEEANFVKLLRKTIIPAQRSNALLPGCDMKAYTSGDDSAAPRIMHAYWVERKIRVPTVHIYGRQDAKFMREMADAARGLCDERWAKKLEHSEGHRPPQRESEVLAAVRAMEWAISQSGKAESLGILS